MDVGTLLSVAGRLACGPRAPRSSEDADSEGGQGTLRVTPSGSPLTEAQRCPPGDSTRVLIHFGGAPRAMWHSSEEAAVVGSTPSATPASAPLRSRFRAGTRVCIDFGGPPRRAIVSASRSRSRFACRAGKRRTRTGPSQPKPHVPFLGGCCRPPPESSASDPPDWRRPSPALRPRKRTPISPPGTPRPRSRG